MLHLPARFATVILPFATMFMQQRTWRHAQLLLLGALLTPVSARSRDLAYGWTALGAALCHLSSGAEPRRLAGSGGDAVAVRLAGGTLRAAWSGAAGGG